MAGLSFSNESIQLDQGNQILLGLTILCLVYELVYLLSPPPLKKVFERLDFNDDAKYTTNLSYR